MYHGGQIHQMLTCTAPDGAKFYRDGVQVQRPRPQYINHCRALVRCGGEYMTLTGIQKLRKWKNTQIGAKCILVGSPYGTEFSQMKKCVKAPNRARGIQKEIRW